MRNFGVFGVLIVVLGACAKDPLPPIELDSVYVEALAPNQDSAVVFMKIRNNSSVSQPLNYAHSPVAGYIEIHRTMYDQGEMKMRTVQRLAVRPGKTENLSSKGYHLMLQDLYDNLQEGDTFDLTLEFETGEVVTEQVEVRPRR